MGELLKGMELNKGAATPLHDERALALPKLIKNGGDSKFRESHDVILELEELGISTKQSSRYQQLAKTINY